MTGVKAYMCMLLMGVVSVWATPKGVSPHVPYAMDPSRHRRQAVEDQLLHVEGNVVSVDPAQNETQKEEGHQLLPGEEEEEEEEAGAHLQVGPSEENNIQSNVVPQAVDQGPLLPDDIKRFLEEKEELLKKIKLLEEANRNLRLADRRHVSEDRNGTIIDTLGSSAEKGVITTRPVDCADHLVLGATRSGIYDIYPFTCLCTKPVQVYCDMETDGGGWTVLLTRQDLGLPPVNFNRTWSEYKLGFGDVGGEYWLGNEIVHTMTNSREYTLRMDLQVGFNDFRTALWKTVTVNNEVNRYKITLGTYSPESTTSANCFPSVSGQSFSTYDRDYDSWASNCALLHGGFWHYRCGTMYPTSVYGKGLVSACYNQQSIAATFVQLKIRPSICGSTFKTVYLNSYDCDSCH